MATTVDIVCCDCGSAFRYVHRTGCLPSRCDMCKRHRLRRQIAESYQRHLEKRRADAREYGQKLRQAAPPRVCACGATLPKHGRLCDTCRAAGRKQAVKAYKTRNRERLTLENREYARKRYAAERDRLRAEAAEWRAKNPERVREIRRSFYWRNVDQVRARRRDSQVRHRMAIYDRDGGVCHICREEVSRDRFEIDHVIPVSRGGSSDPSNLALAHFACNRRKAARLLEEMAA